MHALIVVANPNPESLSHAVSKRIADAIVMSRSAHEVDIADLAAEGFDPRYTLQDVEVSQGRREPSADVRREQNRIEQADALILVYPIYWWSFPALLKGWIDRVFTNGWAFDDLSGEKIIKKMQHLPVHLVSIAGADMRTYARHGYYGAMRTQINHGIFDYCGAPVKTSELMFQSDPEACLNLAEDIGKRIF
ncbi:MAG: NAD(P)H-dependent oxidoreductase [Fibrella sp.]|nr:NAD(P)H-dependent oxidoreductase [Armatimonadota bacterium]